MSGVLIANLNSAAFWINRISPVVTIILGTFGNLCNIVIFTRPTLRNNSCSMYFLAGSAANFVVLYVALLTRYLATSWGYDPSATSLGWCKTRHILVYPSLSLVIWFIVLASVDRFMSSSRNAHYRQWSTVRTAGKIILLTTVIVFVGNAHVLVFAQTVLIGGVSSCTIVPNEYLVFFNIFVPIASCILPLVLMGVFGVLTIVNVRMVRNRVNPQENTGARNERLRSNDRQLIIMLLCQVLITTIIVAPWSLVNMFSAIAVAIFNYQMPPVNQAIYNFAFNVSRVLYYVNPAIGFYIYTLSGPRFRGELKRCFVHGARVVLQTTGLIHWLPARARLGLWQENRTDHNTLSLTRTGKGVTVHVDQN